MCSLSSTLFLIYLEPILRHIKSLLCNTWDTLHALVDDILIRISCPFTAIKIFPFLTTNAVDYGVGINVKKSEIHAMYDSPHFSHGTKEGLTLSTFNESGNPHSNYRYLGVHFYTQDYPSHLVDVISNEIHPFLAELSPLDLKCREIVLVISNRLTPVLAYRMMSHSIPETAILKLDSLISTRLVSTAKDSGLASIAPNTPAA